MLKHIHFIINPKAGVGNNRLDLEALTPYFRKEEYTITLKYSNYKKQALELTQDSIEEGATIIVACGGDGTINEVASCLVGTSIRLGIIPFGSGNGLASNLKIPLTTDKAIAVIKEHEVVTIDVGQINEQYFFSNTGFGFDADIIKNYEASELRTIKGYLRASIKSFREFRKGRNIDVRINDSDYLKNPFMIFISNSNEMGSNISLTPKASLHDGMLDVLIVPEISKPMMLLFGMLMLIRKPHWLKDIKSYQTKNLKINKETGNTFDSQIDGEFHKVKNNQIYISVLEKSLGVIVPRGYSDPI
ncbi:diacylglycerol/lipid kinase family protein [Arenibacter sp. 6A1]|uniref:diacylglycerol/lipid kinase family protein n=1 Tax=Arenibacter sp. 6A1 TaxID=2720391 RepID=UPI001F0F4867|nr:diacylglycerol kinase family protein [Arenibacter sp. 6A1]